MMHHYTMCGLDYVYLSNGYHVHETDYGPGVSIEAADGLDRTIALAVITADTRLSGQDVRFLRSLLKVSQTDIANGLGVKRLTVARWEGAPHTAIPGPADRMLRVRVAKELFSLECVELVVELAPEIAGRRADKVLMTYRRAADEKEPLLLPEVRGEFEGWIMDEAA